MSEIRIEEYFKPEFWSLLARETLVVQRPTEKTYVPLAPRTFYLPGRVALVGVKNPKALPNWRLGAWLNASAPAVAQAGTTNFESEAEVFSERIPLNRFKLVVLPRLADQYRLQLDFPQWHQEALIEIRRYSGPVTDLFDLVAAGGGGGGGGSGGLGGFGAVIG